MAVVDVREFHKKRIPFTLFLSALFIVVIFGVTTKVAFSQNIQQMLDAAKKGDSLEQYRVGTMYYRGQEVPQNYKKAAMWFAKAAEQGVSLAQVSIGIMYYKGLGVPQDYKKAAVWLTKAAEQGNINAQVGISTMYCKGLGVPQDYKKAAVWFTKAAEQGVSVAQVCIGAMYYKGLGVPQDYKKAGMWFAKAAKQGNAQAQDILDKLAAEQNKKKPMYRKSDQSTFGTIVRGIIKFLTDPELMQDLDDIATISSSDQRNFYENLALSNYHSAQTPKERAFWHEKYLRLKEERLDKEREMRYHDREFREDMRHRELLDAIKGR